MLWLASEASVKLVALWKETMVEPTDKVPTGGAVLRVTDVVLVDEDVTLISALFSAPRFVSELMLNVPPLIFVVPVYVLAPLRICVLPPVLTNES